MTAQDHNKTLVIIFSTFAALGTLVVLAAPWVVALAISRRQEQMWAAVFFGFVFLITLLYWCTAIAMHRRKPVGRKLALISAATLIMCWPLVTYIWWFMHSEDAKQMYGVKRE
jgi:hypothetical protein